MDTPSIFDEAVIDIITTNLKYGTIKSGTGTGKTTTLPCKLCKAGNGKNRVIVVLPTKEAVYNAYDRVSTNQVNHVNVDFKCGWSANSIVSYKNYKNSLIRNTLYGEQLIEPDEDDQLVFCTTGHFKRLLKDWIKYLKDDNNIRVRTLNIYDYVIVDEAHLKSRNMEIDIILRYLKYLLISYPKKLVPNVICTSATYDEPKVYDLSSKTGFKVDELWLNIDQNVSMQDRIESIPYGLYNQLERLSNPSVVLIFLPGIKEIRTVMNGFLDIDIMKKLEIVIAHSSRTREQMKNEVFTPNTPGKWKIILATNIAETSLTIPGVRVIVDSCIENTKVIGANKTTFNQKQYISKDSAAQRAGRVGRVANGIVIRVMSKTQFDGLPQTKEAEINRLPITNELLQAIDCNVDYRFIFGEIENGISRSIDEKQAKRIDKTLKELKFLGCIKECSSYYTITDLGKFISSLTVGVKSGCLIYNCIMDEIDPYPVIVTACMIENAEMLFKDFRPHSDFISSVPLATLINPWLKMCIKYGTLKVSTTKLESFCNEFGLNFDVFYDIQRKILDCINKVKYEGYDVDIYMFDPEEIFILIKKYLDRMYFKYDKTIDNGKVYYMSVNKNIKHRPIFLNDRFGNDSLPERVVSILNVDMSGKTQMLVWYPDRYIPTMRREVETMIESTKEDDSEDQEDEILFEEEEEVDNEE